MQGMRTGLLVNSAKPLYVRLPVGVDIDHQMFDCSETLLLTIHYLIGGNSVCRQNTVHPTSFGVSCLWHRASFFQNIHFDELTNWATIHSVAIFNTPARDQSRV